MRLHPRECRGEIEIRLGGTYVIVTYSDVRAYWCCDARGVHWGV